MRKILHRFNMVEIVLAIGVVAFGITGVMALLPPALNANRDTVNDVFVDEAISKMRLLFKTFFEPNFDTCISAELSPYFEKKEDEEKSIANFQSKCQSDYSPAKMETKKLFDWNEDLHKRFRIFRDGNVYYLDTVAKDPEEPGAAPSPTEGDTASAVHVLLYKEKIPEETVGMGTGQITFFSEEFGEGYRIYMIFSWPVTASWNARQKRTVIYDCFRNNH